MSKLPFFPFYPGDWLKDLNLRTRTLEERGAWIDLLAIMHESEERGVLIQNGEPVQDDEIARLIGVSKTTAKRVIKTLVEKGVATRRKRDGALCSRRMIRDEERRNTKRKNGMLGGRPPQ